MSDNPNQRTIDFLAKQKDECFVLIFTRDDAQDYMDGMDDNTIPPVTDEQWRQIIHQQWKHRPSDFDWEDFNETVSYVCLSPK